VNIVSDICNSHSHEKKSQKKTFFKKYSSLLISHHPECDKFKNHTLKIGSLNFCIGCFIGYPTAIIGILVFYFFRIYNLFDSITLLLLGLAFLSFFFLSPLKLTKRKEIKILQKFFLGLGSVFLFWWIWTLTSDIFLNLLLFSVIFGAIIIILNGYHAYSFLKTCSTCKYKTDWHNCPGFKSIYIKN